VILPGSKKKFDNFCTCSKHNHIKQQKAWMK
jgi:hypothetical protein